MAVYNDDGFEGWSGPPEIGDDGNDLSYYLSYKIAR